MALSRRLGMVAIHCQLHIVVVEMHSLVLSCTTVLVCQAGEGLMEEEWLFLARKPSPHDRLRANDFVLLSQSPHI